MKTLYEVVGQAISDTQFQCRPCVCDSLETAQLYIEKRFKAIDNAGLMPYSLTAIRTTYRRNRDFVYWVEEIDLIEKDDINS